MSRVLRWKFQGLCPRQKRRGTIADRQANAVGQTEAEAWAWYDKTFVYAGYTDVEAIAVTEQGRLVFRRQAVSA